MKILTSTPLKYNQTKKSNYTNNVQSFGLNPANIAKRTGDLATDGLAYGFGWLASAKLVQGVINFLKDTNYQRHISAFVGVVLSGYYMWDTAKSKTIEKDQKMPLIVNQGTVSVLSTIGAYSLDGWLDDKLTNTVDTVHIANISDETHRNAMIKYHANKDSFETMESAVKELQTPVKSQRQLVAKSFIDAMKKNEDFDQLVKKYENDRYAKKLFAEINPAGGLNESLKPTEELKNSLEQFYNRTDLFGEVLEDRFQLKNKDIKALKKLVENGSADDTVKELVKQLDTLSNDKKNRLEKASNMFKDSFKNSPTLKKMFAEASFQNSIDILSSSDKNLSLRMKGFRFAKSIMVFAMIYRFVSPVLATPIANTCSDFIENYKKEHKGAMNKVA